MSAPFDANAGLVTRPTDPLTVAADALRSGYATEALIQLNKAPAPLSRQAEWLRAQACRTTGNADGERAALGRVLAAAPRDLGALLAMADLSGREGDRRAQLSFLRSALAQAEASPPPPSAHAVLEQAAATARQLQADLAAHLDAAVAAVGLDQPGASPALRHAVALLRGETDLYLQQPSMFYYPGLPQRPWYERDEFAWVPAFEAEAGAMLAELQAALTDPARFAPYVERSPNRPPPANHLLEDPSWGAAYLWRGGELTAGVADIAPRTLAALASTPQPVVPGRSPMALWSRLTPGTHIKPHHGLLNTRLICHLPLITPDGCAMRVGHETRSWTFGEMRIFDDSFEHEAWNQGADDRIILLFEIWRPEIPAEERDQLTALFGAIDTVDAAGANG
jgi:hypothetical protein